MDNICFSSEDFLDDVKIQIKVKYKNQNNYAKKIGYTRKSLSRLLNCGDCITIKEINRFCIDFDMDMKNYMCKRAV